MKNEKHLEFLQNNISRMNQCSFKVKSWMITIVAAFLALYSSTVSDNGGGNRLYIFASVIPVFLFWILDSFYLSRERRFVFVYNAIIGVTTSLFEIKDYEMPINKIKGFKYSIIGAMLSKTEINLYGVVSIGLIVFGLCN